MRTFGFSDCAHADDFEQIVACGETIWQERVRCCEMTRTRRTVLIEIEADQLDTRCAKYTKNDKKCAFLARFCRLLRAVLHQSWCID